MLSDSIHLWFKANSFKDPMKSKVLWKFSMELNWRRTHLLLLRGCVKVNIVSFTERRLILMTGFDDICC